MDGRREGAKSGVTNDAVLLVEDDRIAARAIAALLRAKLEWNVDVAHDGKQAIRMFERGTYDFVVLDWSLPASGPSGLELCERFRCISPSVGVVVVTGHIEHEEQVRALDAGADDYVTKPFAADILAARLKALARRLQSHHSFVRSVAPVTPCDLACGAIAIHLAEQKVLVDGRLVELTKTQFLLLVYLVRHAGRIVSQKELREHVLRAVSAPTASNLRNHVHDLRMRLGQEGNCIRAVRGAGYCVEFAQRFDVHPDRISVQDVWARQKKMTRPSR